MPKPSEPSSPTNAQPRRRTSLVVFDSSPAEARRIARAMTQVASRIYCAYTFKKAIELTAEKQAAFLLASCQSAESLSFDTLAKFHKQYPQVVIIALSTASSDEAPAMKAGAHAFLSKALDAQQIAEAVALVKKEFMP